MTESTMQNQETESEDPPLQQHLAGIDVPGYEEADELIQAIAEKIDGQDEPGVLFTDVKLTFTRMHDFQVQATDYNGRAKIKPEIGVCPFWYPKGAPVPALAFLLDEKNGYSEWQCKMMHPRLVGASREEIARSVAEWIEVSVFEQNPTLDYALKYLKALRDVGALRWGAPECFGTGLDEGWGAEPDWYVPHLSGESADIRARDLAGEEE